MMMTDALQTWPSGSYSYQSSISNIEQQVSFHLPTAFMNQTELQDSAPGLMKAAWAVRV